MVQFFSKRRLKIAEQIIIVIFFAVLIPMTVSGVIINNINQQSNRAQLRSAATMIANIVSEEIDVFEHSINNELEQIIATLEYYKSPSQEQKYLDTIIQELPIYKELAVVNPNQLEKARAQGRVKKAFPLLQGKAPAEPTETWVRSMLNANNYEIIYFATHGMPYSNVYNTYLQVKSYLDKNKYDFEQLYAAGVKQGKIATPPKMQGKPSKLFSMAMTIMATKEKLLHGTSPLNGFLYLSSEPGKNFYNSKVTAADDGLLTLRDIIQLSDKSFAKTRYVILSACNTAVTYVPDALASGMDEDGTFSSAEIDAELKAQGYLPGVDQVSFIDTFMRKGVQNVYGTLWFVDDNASAEIMSRFMANLVKQQQPDAVAAYNAAQRSILADARADRPASAHFKQNPREMLHPFLWAPGALFGK